MRNSLIWLLVVLCLLTAIPAFSQRAFVKDSLDNYITQAMEQWRVPGLAICIVKDGQIIKMKGYGVRTLGSRDSVDENTLFLIGSNSKAFTATAIAMLDAEKKLSLNDRVTKWMPQFKLNNELAGEQAIIADLLCHRLGFETFQGDFTYWTSNLSRAEVIEKMAHVKALHDFRTTWGYTNAAFLTAGEIIPKVTGLSWEAFIKEKLFTPLGMSRTTALSKEFKQAPNHCSAHTLVKDSLEVIPLPDIDNLAPAGSIGSSVKDMSQWVLMQLQQGELNGSRVVPASAIEKTHSPYSILGNGRPMFNEGHFSLYGLGWFLQEYCGREIVSHTGGVNGFVTSVTLLPEEKLGIVVLTNTDQNYLYEALKLELVDAFLDKPFRNYSALGLRSFQRQHDNQLKKEKIMEDSAALHLPAALPLSSYAGEYESDLYGEMTVTTQQDKLVMHFSHHPHMTASLYPLGGNRFYAIFSDPIFSTAIFPFAVDNGQVKSVTVKVADFVEYTPYEFVKK